MTTPSATPTRRAFGSDETVRWSCQAGDFVLWVGTDPFPQSDRASAWTIRDFWQMRDGDSVTITNRCADLPVWFELHPAEVADAAALQMVERLNAGYRPQEPVDAPNIWRARAGERLVWVTTREPRQPVRQILNLGACVVAIGENSTSVLDSLLHFGEPAGTELQPLEVAVMRSGFNAAAALGTPREFSPKWRIGA